MIALVQLSTLLYVAGAVFVAFVGVAILTSEEFWGFAIVAGAIYLAYLLLFQTGLIET